jgi:hypothetical protein
MVSQLTLQVFGSAAASLASALPERHWHLKGSMALVAYIGPAARLPVDLDVSVGASAAASLLRARKLPSVNEQRVEVVRKEQIRFTDMSQKPPVHRMLLRVRTSKRILGDVVTNVLVVPDDEAQCDQRLTLVTCPFIGIAVPAARLTRCLAQKLLRYVRRRSGGRVNTRWTDLYDFLVTASSPATAGLRVQELRGDVDKEFAYMRRRTPAEIPEPPAEWLDYWDTEMLRTAAPFGQLSEAARKVSEFWSPVLAAAPPARARWNPTTWAWK